MKAYVGTAGWALPAAERHRFDDGASNLARYASRFDCVEINSSFYRRHRTDTWQRWADIVPEVFRFSVKVPKTITHERGLNDCGDLLEQFAGDTRGLGEKFAIALVQLAPKRVFDAAVARNFFRTLQSHVSARIVCEPRHPSWFERDADELFTDCGIARVVADPAIIPKASGPGGSREVGYWRLHGSPNIYRSSYDGDALQRYAADLQSAMATSDVWCIFDNTAASAATRNALDLESDLSS